MPYDAGVFLIPLVKAVVYGAISKRINYKVEKSITQYKIETLIDNSLANVMEKLLPFFESERITERQCELLVASCRSEMDTLMASPEEFFASSLDGQKVFDRFYSNGVLPEAIRDENLEDIYAIVFPQIANLVCAYPPAIEQWKLEGYRDGYRRLDEIANTLGSFASKIDVLIFKDGNTADSLLARVHQSLSQRVQFQIDLTGLRGETPGSVPLDMCFVVPQLLHKYPDERRINIIETQREISDVFQQKSERAVIIGNPGSGKSTLSIWLQRLLLNSEIQKLAICVNFRKFVRYDSLPSYLDIIKGESGTHLKDEISADVVRNWCKSGSLVFILDGFDEVPPENRDLLLDWVIDLGNVVENSGIIITSRPLMTHHIDALLKTWQKWEIQPFDKERIRDYISRWYTHAPLLVGKSRDVDADKLAETWIRDTSLKTIVGIPLMLATILMVHHMDGEMPRYRAKLYERYIEGMLGSWDSRWGVPAAIDLAHDVKKRILTKLALYLHLNQVEQIGDTEINQLLDDILPQVGCIHLSHDVLNNLRERSGLLVGPGTWSFIHKNVSEFLVAAAICDGDQKDSNGQSLDRFYLFEQRHNDRWNAVMFFWTGLATPGDLKGFINQVSNVETNIDFCLSFRLVYDQLQPHRLDKAWRKGLLFGLLNRGLQEDNHRNAYCIWAPHPKEMEACISIPSSVLMLMLPNDLEKDILYECLHATGITWLQASGCHKSLQFLLWIGYTTHMSTLDELRFTLHEQSKANPVNDEWLAFAIAMGLSPRLWTKTGISEYITVITDVLPQYTGRFVFFLFGAFINTIETYHLNHPTNAMQMLLQSILSFQQYEVDEQWLAYSKQYTLTQDMTTGLYFTHKEYDITNITGHKPECFDLLDLTIKKIDEAIQSNLISESSITEQVRKYIRRLEKMRKAII